MAEGFSSICSVFTHLHWQKQQINKCLNRNHSQDCHLLFYFLHDGQCPKPVGTQSNGCILNLVAYEMVVYLLINAVWGMRENAVTSHTGGVRSVLVAATANCLRIEDRGPGDFSTLPAAAGAYMQFARLTIRWTDIFCIRVPISCLYSLCLGTL